eukprot:m.17836 g.17836  ORF g.17836 m.17836 type:complete len:304 (+) comp3539_c0_seq1:1596-2507(+)
MGPPRAVQQVVPATDTNRFKRLIGTLDFKGQGTDHRLADVEPYVLFDDAQELQGKGVPPFGYHPHAHLIAMTVVLDGLFEDGDSIGGPGPHTHGPGSLYMAQAGTGLFHMERSAAEGTHSVFQIIVKMRQDAWNDAPQVYRLKAEDVPSVALDGGVEARVLVGEMSGATSPATVSGLPDVLLLRVFVPAGTTTIKLPVDSRHTRGWLYVRSGTVQAASTKGGGVELSNASGIAVFGDGDNLELTNANPETPVEFVVGAGKPSGEPWVKLLGHNGFVLGATEAEAEADMARVVAEHTDKVKALQ